MAEWVTRVSDIMRIWDLTDSEMETNALNVSYVLADLGWSQSAIAGALGNIDKESSINPGACETNRGVPVNYSIYFGGGLGLIQWTDYPAYSKQHVHPLLWYADDVGADWWDGTMQCELMDKADDSTITSCGQGVGPLWGWMQPSSGAYIPFSQYKVFTGTPEQAAEYWLYDLERPGDISSVLQERQVIARYWYDFLDGKTPTRPVVPTDPIVRESKQGMPVWMMCSRPDVRRV